MAILDITIEFADNCSLDFHFPNSRNHCETAPTSFTRISHGAMKLLQEPILISVLTRRGNEVRT